MLHLCFGDGRCVHTFALWTDSKRPSVPKLEVIYWHERIRDRHADLVFPVVFCVEGVQKMKGMDERVSE